MRGVVTIMVMVGVMVIMVTALPLGGEGNLGEVWSNITALWEKVDSLTREINDHHHYGHTDPNHDKNVDEVRRMKHEHKVHHLHHPHLNHNEHHDGQLLQHLETEHGHDHHHDHSGPDHQDTGDHSHDHGSHGDHDHHTGNEEQEHTGDKHDDHDLHEHDDHHHHHHGHGHGHGHGHHHGHHHGHQHGEGEAESGVGIGLVRADYRARAPPRPGQDMDSDEDSDEEGQDNHDHDHDHDHDHHHDHHDGHDHHDSHDHHDGHDHHDHDHHDHDHHDGHDHHNHDHHDHDHDHHDHDHDHHDHDHDHDHHDHGHDHDHHDYHHDHDHHDHDHHDDHHDHDHHDHDHHHDHRDDHQGGGNDPWAHARCTLEPNVDMPESQVRGHVVISQKKGSSGPTYFDVNLSGIDTATTGRVHGFHIHESALSEAGNCGSAGGHFNPFSVEHGAATSSQRHVGDLGNIVVEEDGSLRGHILTDTHVAFTGENNIISKSIVVHAGEDDLGLGGSPSSLTTGNAGGRLACCNIYMEAVPILRIKG